VLADNSVVSRHSLLTRWTARGIQAMSSFDKLYLGFNRVRSAFLLAFASDAVLEAHLEVYYGRTWEDDSRLAAAWLPWERRAIEFFPPPPAKVLVGAAGWGREARVLAAMGYSVVAFEPVRRLAEKMASETAPLGSVRVYRGTFQDMPFLEALPTGARGDLRNDGPFDAAIVGYGSLSHLLRDAQRVETLRRFAEVTQGPILVSFYASFPEAAFPERLPAAAHTGWLRRWLRQRKARRGTSRFQMNGGYFRLLSREEIEGMASEVGLSVLHAEIERDLQPYAVLSPKKA
jgi:hypothetical protein